LRDELGRAFGRSPLIQRIAAIELRLNAANASHRAAVFVQIEIGRRLIAERLNRRWRVVMAMIPGTAGFKLVMFRGVPGARPAGS
jgi:hypothetical protein